MPFIMIFNTSDYYISLNNIYASLIMASAMILAMNFVMPLSNNIIILNLIILAISILGIRNQWFINDKMFLRDMIPHHSMALQTSSHIIKKTNNSKLKELATNIIYSQTKEIQDMKNLL